MPDLSRHIAKAVQSLKQGNPDLVFETLGECFDIDPAQPELHRLWLDAAKLKARTAGKGGLFGGLGGGLSLSRDPIKVFVAQIRRLTKSYDTKVLFDCGEAAQKCTAARGMVDIAIIYYEEVRATGLFHEKALWNLGHCYMDRFRGGGRKDGQALDNALRSLRELLKAMPTHPEASRILNNWEAEKSMLIRNSAGSATSNAGDYRTQLASDTGAKRLELLNRAIRTSEDAQEVLLVLAEELKAKPGDKALWMKQGKILARYGTAAQACAAFQKVLEIDPHDFLATVDIADVELAERRRAIERAKAAGEDPKPLEKALLDAEIAEYRRRIERQPTDLGHRFQLGQRLIRAGDVEAAAAEFQRTAADPKHRRGSLRALGWCFARKNLLDLARQQYDAYLAIAEDDSTDEAKEVRYWRAQALESLKRRDDAIADLNRLVALDLGYRDAAQRLAALQSPA